MNNFMSHKETCVELPSTGVILVTGPNGSGKSSIAESVACSLWGKTLRGSSPWVRGEKGVVSVGVEFEDGAYTFERKASASGKATASFDPAPATYSTNTKTQTAIDSIVGPFDAWKRCSVFSSQDAAHFTLSTDAERKRLLETLLGLDRFDLALKDCRDEHKEISAKILKLEKDLIRNNAAEDHCISSIDYNKSKYHVEKTRVKHYLMTDEELERRRALLREQQKEHIQIQADIDKARSKLYGVQAEQNQVRKGIQVYSNTQCPTCYQKLEGEEVHKLKESMAAELVALDTEAKLITKTLESLKKEDTVLGKLIRDGQTEVSKQEAYRASENCVLLKHLESCIAKSEEEMKDLKKEAKKIKKDLSSYQYTLALNENTQTVLGTKGVRAHILTAALDALELTSNRWLKKITKEEVTIKIKPYATNKTGGRRDAISLEIVGLGNGEGYKALSGGQRRRIDVALLLGLSELSQATKVQTRGTVFFDEVFDSLDEEGIALVSGVIEEMASDRPVVVVSHSPDLVAGLHAHTHIHVDNGSIVYA